MSSYGDRHRGRRARGLLLLLALCLSATSSSSSGLRACRQLCAKIVLAGAIVYPTNRALANDEEKLTTRQVIIRSTENFLTNPVLEALRKADQFDFDVPDDVKSATTKVLLLYPIVEIEGEVSKMERLLSTEPVDKAQLESIRALVQQPKYSAKLFKKIFNRYSDNIFYSNAQQANIYLAGGTTPDSHQTEQYLFRNAILTAIEFIQQDVADLLSQPVIDKQDVQDMISDVADARKALAGYMRLADPDDLSVALQLLKGKGKQ